VSYFTKIGILAFFTGYSIFFGGCYGVTRPSCPLYYT